MSETDKERLPGGEENVVRVNVRLSPETYQAMVRAASPIGLRGAAGVVRWFALLGLQAAQGGSAATRTADMTALMLAEILKAAEAEKQAPSAS